MKRILVRSNGLKIEFFEISEPLVVFVAPPENRYPLPIRDEIMSDNMARELIRDLKREPRFKRKV